MPKWKAKQVEVKADYFVTGVWIDKLKNITHLLLHEATDEGGCTLGEITPVGEIVQLLDEGKIVKSLRWSYITAQWNEGIIVKPMTKPDGSRSVKAVSDNIITNHLNHLILMHSIV